MNVFHALIIVVLASLLFQIVHRAQILLFSNFNKINALMQLLVFPVHMVIQIIINVYNVLLHAKSVMVAL